MLSQSCKDRGRRLYSATSAGANSRERETSIDGRPQLRETIKPASAGRDPGDRRRAPPPLSTGLQNAPRRLGRLEAELVGEGREEDRAAEGDGVRVK
eukprot:3438004-Pyramimonas_sp.AAC.2